MKEYWQNIQTTVRTLKGGLKHTAKHLKSSVKQRDPLGPSAENYFEKQNALFTTQYPKEKIPVPDNGRYKLHNEIDDCIVCDKCAKVCPVNCIDIEPIRATEEIGKTSDGTPKRIYAAKFDIDMAKCCFCGLCTTVCPTECLTMTSDYDFSAFDFAEHNFPFAEMTPMEILEKKKELEEFNTKKAAEKAKTTTVSSGTGPKKPVFKPKVPGAKPVIKPKIEEASGSKPKVVIKPKIQVKKEGDDSPQKVKPVIKPRIPSPKKDKPEDEQ